MRAEELSDQLLLAAEQHDVSSVLVTLRKMKEENCLEQAINNNRESSLPFNSVCELLLTLYAEE